MSIQDFFTMYFVTKRSVWTTDISGNPYSDEVEQGSFYGHLQESEPGLVESLGMSFTSPYTVWCPVNTDVKAGDIITSVTGQFTVKAVQKYEIGGNKHLQLLCQLDEIMGS